MADAYLQEPGAVAALHRLSQEAMRVVEPVKAIKVFKPVEAIRVVEALHVVEREVMASKWAKVPSLSIGRIQRRSRPQLRRLRLLRSRETPSTLWATPRHDQGVFSYWLQYEISSTIFTVHLRYEILSVIDVHPLSVFIPSTSQSVLVSLPTRFIIFPAVRQAATQKKI